MSGAQIGLCSHVEEDGASPKRQVKSVKPPVPAKPKLSFKLSFHGMLQKPAQRKWGLVYTDVEETHSNRIDVIKDLLMDLFRRH